MLEYLSVEDNYDVWKTQRQYMPNYTSHNADI